ncbi:tudor domain protein [Dictyocaulus viviparus]|uniref:Tudor domain protein n=1 Tax=Dictyocaulus viviparus TaxID=29172 RepID=A0A0D8XZW7_DICVI|nr:tudor domain protein [Dictyocaulus viviparus]
MPHAHHYITPLDTVAIVRVIRSHSLLFAATTKALAQQNWSDLTNGITVLRRTLSKLEANAYDVLSTRFERVNVNGVSMKPSDSNTSIDSNSNNNSPTKKSAEDLLSMDEDDSEEKCDAIEQSFDNEIDKEFSMAISAVSTKLPPSQFFKKDEEFLAKVLCAVSPLEFYVIKVAHIRVLREIERLISYCSEKLCSQTLSDSLCWRENACLVRFEDNLARATIGHSGAYDLQVYLVDYGRSMFINRSECFAMPKFIAQYAPPLAHYCTLNDVDSRALDHATVKAFHEKILSVSEVTLKCEFLASVSQYGVDSCFGERRRTHGELVEIID